MNSLLDRIGYIMAEQPKQVVFCLGAGVSARYGVPNWGKLNKNIFSKLLEYKKQFASNEVDQLIIDEKSLKDQWVYGAFLKKHSPANLYIEWIRDELNVKSIASKTYKYIWALNPKGIISFNLDGLIVENYPDIVESQNISYGLTDSTALRFFIKDSKWIYFPHGNIKRPESWVFTRDSRNTLLERESYKRFMNTVFNGYHVVLVGINPKDYSLEDVLRKSKLPKEHSVRHFWIHCDPNAEDRIYAEENGLELIPFSSSNNYAELDNYLNTLSKYSPRDRDGDFAYFGESIDPDFLCTRHHPLHI